MVSAFTLGLLEALPLALASWACQPGNTGEPGHAFWHLRGATAAGSSYSSGGMYDVLTATFPSRTVYTSLPLALPWLPSGFVQVIVQL